MNSTSIAKTSIQDHLKKSAAVSRRLQLLGDDKIADILNKLADLTIARSQEILEANQKDLDRMDSSNPKYDRLLLNHDRLEGIANDLRKVAALNSPLGKVLQERTLKNGLHLQKVSVPLGVIGIVFESRPNVTFDVFALCFKSGNASVLKGSRDAHFSNLAILKLIHEVLAPHGLMDACYLAPSEREALAPILEAIDEIDIIIPRGGQGLIQYVRANAKVPVIETGAGIVHAYFDKSADANKGEAIISNAKARRVSVCNALDTLLIHKDRLTDLPMLLEDLGSKHQCEIFADATAYKVLQDHYPSSLLHKAKVADFGTEFLSMKLSVKTVPDVDAAIEHVSANSSKHSETVIAEDPSVITHYLNAIDAAVVYANASTAFTDGAQFGMGAEIGISTQKLHARGPMALEELTSYKWKVWGDGQVRE